MHEEIAPRCGMSYVESPEQSFRNSSDSPENTTLRLADSVNLFETGALAPGVTIENADYRVLALDAGFKYKGIFLQAEYYQRWSPHLTLCGGIPSTLVLADTSDADFEAYMDELFRAIAPGWRIVIGIADQVPPAAVFSLLHRIA